MTKEKVKSMGDHLRDAITSMMDAETSAKKAILAATANTPLASIKEKLANSSKYVKDTAWPSMKKFSDQAISVLNPPTLKPVELMFDYEDLIADKKLDGDELELVQAMRTIDMLTSNKAIPVVFAALGVASIYETRIQPHLDKEFFETYATGIYILMDGIASEESVNKETFNTYLVAISLRIPETSDDGTLELPD